MITIKNIIKYMSLIMLSTLLLGIGYASISDINLSLNGTAKLDKDKSVLITDASILSSSGVDSDLSTINNYFHTNLDSTIELDGETSTVTVQVKLLNNTSKDMAFKGIVYDENFYDNENITYELSGLNVDDVLKPNDEVTCTLTFKYSNYSQDVEKILSSVLNFRFESGEESDYSFDGLCKFKGQGQDIEGACANGQHIDYINTGISLFSEENYSKDFEMYFEIDNIDPSRFRNGQVDTVFHSLYENKPYPGVLLRIQNSKWLLQIGNGINNKKITFEPEKITSVKIKRVLGKIYYSINGGEDIFAVDAHVLSGYFNNPTVIGTALDAVGNPDSAKFLVADLVDVYVHLSDTGFADLDEYYENLVREFMEEPLTEVYSLDSHTFNGEAESGLNTNVYLFSEQNYQKSFRVTLTLDSINHQSQTNQATLFNAKDESNATYPGLVLRKKTGGYELSMKDGLGQSSTATIPSDVRKINILRKGTKYFYQYDFNDIEPLGINNDFSSYPASNCFEIGATFGSNINGDGNFDRIMSGTLTDMKISIGS